MTRRGLRRVEYVLLAAGLAILGYCGAELLNSHIQQARGARELEQLRRNPPAISAAPATIADGTPVGAGGDPEAPPFRRGVSRDERWHSGARRGPSGCFRFPWPGRERCSGGASRHILQKPAQYSQRRSGSGNHTLCHTHLCRRFHGSGEADRDRRDGFDGNSYAYADHVLSVLLRRARAETIHRARQSGQWVRS